jgi:hypothetical protein
MSKKLALNSREYQRRTEDCNNRTAKRTLLFVTALLLSVSLCRAQTETYKEINIQKQQLTLADLITLTQSNSLDSVNTFMATKGWRKLSFEISRKDNESADNNYRGKLPLGFLRDESQYNNYLPSDYKKLIWGLAYAEDRDSEGNVSKYSETYCYVYFSSTEVSAVAYGNPVSDKAYRARLLAQLTDAGFTQSQETLIRNNYRNDTYELEIAKLNQFFFYNHKEFEAQKARLKAESDRQNQEQREKMQEKINTETLNELLPYAYELGQKGIYPREALLDLDVLTYFSENIPREKIDSELKIASFKKSEEYAKKLNTMQKWRQQVFSSVYYIRDDQSYHDFSSSFYGKTGDEHKYKYSITEQGFKIPLLTWNNPSPMSKAICLSDFGASKTRFLIANPLPVKLNKDKDEYFLASIDETTALEIENNRENMQTYLFFMLNGKYENNTKARYEQILYTDKVRIVIANKKTGKIYYDRSFPENSLPIALKERMSPEEYQKYITNMEQKRLAAKKAEEERKQAKILAERKAEEERIQAKKLAEEQRIEAAKQKRRKERASKVTLYDFSSETDNRNLIDDDAIPGGKGKALLFDKKNKVRSFGVIKRGAISFWIKDCSAGIIWSYTQNPLLINKSKYTSPLLLYSGKQLSYACREVSETTLTESENYKYPFKVDANLQDGKWHLLTTVFDEILSRATITVYLDTTQVYTNEFRQWYTVPNNHTFSFQLGDKKNGSIMKIYNLRLYRTKLTAEDIVEIYEEDNKGASPTPPQ